MESLVSDIPGRDGKNDNFFRRVLLPFLLYLLFSNSILSIYNMNENLTKDMKFGYYVEMKLFCPSKLNIYFHKMCKSQY
jgi:hypothetical protein